MSPHAILFTLLVIAAGFVASLCLWALCEVAALADEQSERFYNENKKGKL